MHKKTAEGIVLSAALFTYKKILLVIECAELALDSEALLAFLDMTYYLSIDVEAL